MKRIVLAALLTTAALTTPAHAVPDVHAWFATIPSLRAPATGTACTFAAVTDPTAEPDTVNGVLLGGPVVVSAQFLECRVQNGTATHDGSGPSVGAFGELVVVTTPQFVSLHAAAEDQLYLCAELFDNFGNTLYWDGIAKTWSANPAVHCTVVSHAIVPLP